MIEIPDAAREFHFQCGCGQLTCDREGYAEEALPLIVAAELRRLADALDARREEMREEDDRTVRSSGLGEGIRRLRERADELDPQGGAR